MNASRVADEPLHILVLHHMGDPTKAPHFLLKHVHCLQQYAPEHAYVYHDAALPVPAFVKDIAFDGVVLDVTLLALRWADAEYFARVREDLRFLTDTSAFKIALPQDEYDCSELLDDWLCEMRVDLVHSVIDAHWDILYPRYHRLGRIELGFTGYLDEASFVGAPSARPWEQRRVDVGYRAQRILPHFGRMGETKVRIGDRFLRAATGTDLVCDIVVGEQGTILGTRWLDFLGDCRFVLGSNSGSSLLDPRGEIRRNVRAYCLAHPNWTFEEVESQTFAGQDDKYEFTALSPRVIEAAATMTGQILVRGPYSGILRPWEHYIPLDADCGNFDEVYRAMRDHSLVTRMIQACREALLSEPRLRHTGLAARLTEAIRNRSRSTGIARPAGAAMAAVRARYRAEVEPLYPRLWRASERRRRIERRIERLSPALLPLVRKAYRWARDHSLVPSLSLRDAAHRPRPPLP